MAARGEQLTTVRREQVAKRNKRGAGRGETSGLTEGGPLASWNLMLRIWPLEDRPDEMKIPEVVNGLSFDQLIKYKKHYEALIKREGKGEGVFGKDSDIPAVFFEEGEDNCADLLHPARFQRLPVVERKKWWHLVPVKRSHTFRRLALVHAGAEGKVSECVIIRAHDRSLPLKLKMFFSNNRAQKGFGSSESKEAAQDWDTPKVLVDIQEAVLNYADVYADLWPEDDSPRVMSRVLVHYNYGAACKSGEAERSKIVVEFCDSLMRDNACRAVVKETPLSFRRAKEKWADMAERFSGAAGRSASADGAAVGVGGRVMGRRAAEERRPEAVCRREGRRPGFLWAGTATRSVLILTNRGAARGGRLRIAAATTAEGVFLYTPAIISAPPGTCIA